MSRVPGITGFPTFCFHGVSMDEPLLGQDPVEDRFWRDVQIDSGCWEWSGSISANGYGKLHVPGYGYVSAHRYMYFRFNPLEDRSLCVCHTCDNRLCVRLDHLFLATHQENMRDMVAKGRRKGPTPTRAYPR